MKPFKNFGRLSSQPESVFSDKEKAYELEFSVTNRAESNKGRVAGPETPAASSGGTFPTVTRQPRNTGGKSFILDAAGGGCFCGGKTEKHERDHRFQTRTSK
jgi:hypothetical protein